MKIYARHHLIGAPSLAIRAVCQIDMRHLPARMHAGIGAPGAEHRHLLAAKFFDRFGQNILHRTAAFLALPPDKGRAVIFNAQAIAGHNFCPAARPRPRINASAAMAGFPAFCTRMSSSAPRPQ